jgi:polysaccharide biosynthesis/export protein PslD
MHTRRRILSQIAPLLLLGSVARATETKPAKAPDISFAAWDESEPAYVFYPGDKLEIQVQGAPELNRTTQVAPDGRITLGLIGPVMAAYRSTEALQADITARYAGVLLKPRLSVFPLETAPVRVLIGGEVKNPGWIDMNGDLDALSAVMAAGGFTHASKTAQVVLIRRARDGRAMRRILDLKSPLKGHSDRLYALRRNDLVFVPRTNIAEAGVFVEQYINNLIPGAMMNYFTYRTFD